MLNNRSKNVLMSTILGSIFCYGAYAQEQRAEGKSDPQTQYKSVVLDGEQKLELDFNISSLGSVTIQVMQKPQTGADAKGVAGFNVRLRSKDPRFERWYLDQLTDDAGTYTFDCLRPGTYTIELDPAGLSPTRPLAARRSLL